MASIVGSYSCSDSFDDSNFGLQTTSRAALGDLSTKLFREQAYVGGQWLDAPTAKTFVVKNPEDNSVLGTCPDMDHNDTITAIETAQKSFETFRHTRAQDRARILRRWYELIKENEDELARILMRENGRPITGSKQEIQYSASFVDWFAGEASRSYGYTTEGTAPGNRVVTIKQPIGVVGVLTPWNFPSAMITRKVAAAIAAGCTVVVKPAAETPYSALALADLAEQAGLPKGVMNVVTTNEHLQEVGREICTHPLVKKISFTGSTRVGKMLMQMASSTMKKCSFELGGNAPFIVFDDADIQTTVDGLLAGKFRGSGQTCVSPNRVFVQDGIHDRLVEELRKRVQADMQPDSFEHPQTIMGSLINEAAADKVESLVEDAVSKGAKVLVGGKRQQGGDERPLNRYPATMLTDMTPQMEAHHQEIFGPLLAIYRFQSEQEALKLANDTSVGLAGYIFTSSLPRAWRVAELLEVGMTGINTGIVSDPVAPFGGIKESGFGREGGKDGVEEFQVTKTITLGGLGVPVTPLTV
ncbi:succinate semialdehyde dehydrogenase NADP+ linked [Aspergillus brasiliensis]|nr:succinate semialdehyde dehydrogenase NADP+ linked [Aspergillus brasiliensis]